MMTQQILDITEDGHYLQSKREWLVVSNKNKEVVKVYLAELECVLVHSKFATYSHSLLTKLGEKNIPLVVCNDRHYPISSLTPLFGHHMQAGRSQAQADAKKPLKKQLWRQIIKKKIEEQGKLLTRFNKQKGKALLKMRKKVIENDVDNIEAKAARYYWRNLFGNEFRRDRDEPGLNAHLNYGYTIIRSALARALIASGLVPSLGVGHYNKRNNFCLVDDLIEPFRPIVDCLVKQNERFWTETLTKEAKITIAGLLDSEVRVNKEYTDLKRAFSITVKSLVDVYEAGKGKIIFPDLNFH